MKQPVYPPGTIIAGRYRVDRAVARGGCSIVYQGTHLEMERPVALKLMSSVDGQVDRAWVERFKREAQLASQLHHPNTITIYDYGASQGVLFITMEWVQGDSLRNVIKAQGALSPKRVAHLTVQLLESLAEAHRLHILHRDLKPSNIMLTQDLQGQEQLKVLDFGLAKANPPGYNDPEALKLTKDGDFVGTPRYAAPEQLRGKELTRASDLYGVGMVMWEMLTGKPAVPDVDFGTCVLHHLGPTPWTLPPELRCPPALARVVERALLKDASQRYQSCEEMLAELRELLREPAGPDPRALFGPEGGHARHVQLDTPPEPSAPGPATLAQAASQAKTTPKPAASLAGSPSAPSLQAAPSFSQLNGDALELDRTATPASRSPAGAPLATSPQARPTSPTQASPQASRRPTLHPGVAAGAVVTLLLIIALGAWGLRRGGPALAPSQEDVQEAPGVASATLQDASPPTASPHETPHETPREVIRALIVLKRAGWAASPPAEATRVGACVQQNIRIRHEARGQSADLVVFTCDDAAAKQEVLTQTARPSYGASLSDTIATRVQSSHEADHATARDLAQTLSLLDKKR